MGMRMNFEQNVILALLAFIFLEIGNGAGRLLIPPMEPPRSSATPLCGQVITSTGTTVTFREGLSLTPVEFERVHIQKLYKATFTPQSNCALNICGYTTFGPGSGDEYGDCELVDKPSNADTTIYNEKFNTSSIGCGCNIREEDCMYTCSLRASAIRWEQNDCAYLFEESDCKSCFFTPIPLSVQQKEYVTTYSQAVVSLLVKENCTLNHSVPAFAKMSTHRKDPINYIYVGPAQKNLVPSAFQSDPETFYCTCDGYVPPPDPGPQPSPQPGPSPTPEPGPQPTPDPAGGDISFSFVGVIISVLALATICGIFLWKRKVLPASVFNYCRGAPTDDSVIPPVSVSDSVFDDNEETYSGSGESNSESAHSQHSDVLYPNADRAASNSSGERSSVPPLPTAEESFVADFNGLYDTTTAAFKLSRHQFTILEEDIAVRKRLGAGKFGGVLKGYLQRESLGAWEVAVKIIVRQKKHTFLRETKNYLRLGCGNVNVLQFLGACCHSDGLFLLTEICDHGSLSSYLVNVIKPDIQNRCEPFHSIPVGMVQGRTDYLETDLEQEQEWLRKKSKLTTGELLQFLRWCQQVTNGMTYLHEEIHLIHLDLATRNVLLKGKVAKVADFGLSRAESDKDYLIDTLSSKSELPVNSLAPEHVHPTNPERMVTRYVDVWAYGCFLWQLFNLGQDLYPHVKEVGVQWKQKIKQLLRQGELHRPPALARDHMHIYAKMCECWSKNPEDRPQFRDMREYFAGETRKIEAGMFRSNLRAFNDTNVVTQ